MLPSICQQLGPILGRLTQQPANRLGHRVQRPGKLPNFPVAREKQSPMQLAPPQCLRKLAQLQHGRRPSSCEIKA